jgi:branched-chain amino acid transport system permease protein
MLLGQDGITNGAIYALLALSILLVFTVTRILLIPQGEFVTYGALTMATLQEGHPTALVWLLLGLTIIDCALDLYAAARSSHGFVFPKRIIAKLGYALLMVVLIMKLPLADLPMAIQALLTLALVVPLGPQIYRLVFQPIASASSLVLLIVSIAVHVSMVGIALLLFGPEGARTRPFYEARHSGFWRCPWG